MMGKDKTLKVVKAIAAEHNLDPKDINSEVYEDRPLIAELDLQIKVIEFCKAKRFDLAAEAIEIEVRREYQCEACA